MHTQSDFGKPLSGKYHSVKLAITPEPPLAPEERSHWSENYPTALGYLHLYLDQVEATVRVPSAYMLWLLNSLLNSVSQLLAGKQGEARWVSDPWELQLRSKPARNLLCVTLHMPNRVIAIEEAWVPLDSFVLEVVKVSKEWAIFLQTHYSDEIMDPGQKGKQYRRFQQFLQAAQQAIDMYS